MGGGVLAIWGPADDLRSRLHEQMGDWEQATTAARRACGLAQTFGSSYFLVRSQLHLAELLSKYGSRADLDMALMLLRDARRLAATHEVATERSQIEALLAELT